MTVLFCDIVNSTGLTERLGSEGMHDLLGRFFEVGRSEVERYGGTVNKYLGDGFMSLVGVPTAYEDHAQRAVLTALAIHERLRHGRDEAGEPEFRVRMGLSTGRALVGGVGEGRSLDHTAVGDTMNVAARLQARAEPGTIVVSEATARMVAGHIRLEPLGPVEVRGRSSPVTAFRVTGFATRRSPADAQDPPAPTPFLGRSRHLASLGDLFEQASAGEGQAVGIVGEPGIGKTRLVTEFRRSLRDSPATLLEGRCLSYGGATPYLPLRDLVCANCAIADGDEPAVTEMKVRAGLEEVGLDPQGGAPLLLQLLGVASGTEALAQVSAQAVKTRTFETLLQMSVAGARRRPLVFVIEDLHWVDRTSEEFLTSLVNTLDAEPILLLGTYRPGYQPPWAGRSYTTQLSLSRLALGDSKELVRALLPSAVADQAQLVVQRGDGNPFFLEELARAVNGGEGPDDPIVPETVEGLLMARIDRLDDEPRRLLQVGAVLGREFSSALLALLWDGDDLDVHLLELKRQEFLQASAARDETRYAFKHALIQEVAYESLLSARRKALHAAAARALETLYQGRLEQVFDRLAHHWDRAEEPQQAVEALSRFAEQAAGAYAHVEAAEALRKALSQVEGLPPETRARRRIEIVLALARSLYFMGRFPESLRLLTEHAGDAEESAEPGLMGSYHFWLAHTHSHLGDGHPEAVRHAGQAIAAAELAGDSGTVGRAHYVLSREGFWSGSSRRGPSTAGRRSRGSNAPASGGVGAAGAGHPAPRGGSRSPTAGGASTSSRAATSSSRSASSRGHGRSGRRWATAASKATPTS